MYRRISAVVISLLLVLSSVLVLASCGSGISEGGYGGSQAGQEDGAGAGSDESGKTSTDENENDPNSGDNSTDEGESSKTSTDENESDPGSGDNSTDEGGSSAGINKDGTYDQKEDVAEYLKIYRKLPKNYITKKEAKRLGWQGGSVEQVAPGKAIGGDHFGNYEKKLPEKSGRDYYECDIDTLGRKNRGAKRIVYSDDGLIYYTEDHYNSFSRLPQSA